MYNIVITGSALPHIEKEIEALSDIAKVTYKNCGSQIELVGLTKDADIIMTDSEGIGRDVIDNAKRLRAVVEYGIGVDNIDVRYASEKGILVCNVPDVFVNEVAEHAASLMFAVARNIVGMSKMVTEEYIWDFNRKPVLKLHGKTLGVVGFGNIGRSLARIALGVGMNVAAYDPFVRAEAIRDAGCMPLTFEELVSVADVISLHVPHNDKTHYLLGEKEFNSMKQDAILVNVSRGGVVDEVALANALGSGKLFGAGIDVLENEPDVMNSPLLGCPNAIITPHMAWKSESAAWSLEMAAVKEVRSILLDEKPIHPVNKPTK